jgi:hypothetical protein
MSAGDQAIDYKTHILIGARTGGGMTVIAVWPYVPRQAEVQKKIEGTRDHYTTFVLCTPTSIMPSIMAQAVEEVNPRPA